MTKLLFLFFPLFFPPFAFSLLSVCADCTPTPFDADELTWALLMLGTVTAIFLAICTCRCYPKLKTVFFDGGQLPESGRAPPAEAGHP